MAPSAARSSPPSPMAFQPAVSLCRKRTSGSCCGRKNRSRPSTHFIYELWHRRNPVGQGFSPRRTLVPLVRWVLRAEAKTLKFAVVSPRFLGVLRVSAVNRGPLAAREPLPAHPAPVDRQQGSADVVRGRRS